VAAPGFDALERDQLCALLDRLGPDAPTLLPSWTAHDLAAHLVVREHELLAAPGLVVPGPWSRVAERRRLTVRRRPFSELVATVRVGPPPGFFRRAWVRRFPNLNEFFVHHEDVRRANDDGPRTVCLDEEEALFRNLGRAPWLLARRLRGAGLEFVWAGTDRAVQARRGRPVARVHGRPGELLLFAFGRESAAAVEITGPAEAVDAVRRARFGM
jgi:uncharacterized protein (TIGR03085 family)